MECLPKDVPPRFEWIEAWEPLPPAALEDAAEAAEAWRQQALEHLRESLSKESREKRKRSTTLHRTASFDYQCSLLCLPAEAHPSGNSTQGILNPRLLRLMYCFWKTAIP